jgi:hypothetical protein
LPVDAAGAHLVLGVIACLENDVDELHRRHRLAINLAPVRHQAIAYYGVSLARLSLFDEAIPQLEAVVELVPEDKTALATLITMSFRAGRLRAADRWLTVWDQRCPGQKHELESLIRTTLEFARYHEITDDDLATSIREAVRLILVRKVPQGTWEGGLFADDDDIWISYRLRVYAEPNEVAELCEALADRYAAMELNATVATRYSVGYGVEPPEVASGGNA